MVNDNHCDRYHYTILCNITELRAHEIHYSTFVTFFISLFIPPLDEKYFFLCPDRLRLPLIFYFGHTATLYVNKLLLAGLIKVYNDIDLEYMPKLGLVM